MNKKIEKIYKRFDPASMEIVEEEAEKISGTEIAEILLKTEKDVVVNKFSNMPHLGRFVLEKDNNIVAGGVII